MGVPGGWLFGDRLVVIPLLHLSVPFIFEISLLSTPLIFLIKQYFTLLSHLLYLELELELCLLKFFVFGIDQLGSLAAA